MPKLPSKSPNGIAQWLKQARVKFGWSQEQLADKVRAYTGDPISYSTIKQYEESKRPPSPRTIWLICETVSKEATLRKQTGEYLSIFDFQADQELYPIESPAKYVRVELERLYQYREKLIINGVHTAELDRQIDLLWRGLEVSIHSAERENIDRLKASSSNGAHIQESANTYDAIARQSFSNLLLNISGKNHKIECTKDCVLVRCHGTSSVHALKEAHVSIDHALSITSKRTFIADMTDSGIPNDFERRFSVDWLLDNCIAGIVFFGSSLELCHVLSSIMDMYRSRGGQLPIISFCNDEMQAKSCLVGMQYMLKTKPRDMKSKT